jgi:hypothetical protein
MTIFKRSQFSFMLANRTRATSDSRCQCNHGGYPNRKRCGSPHCVVCITLSLLCEALKETDPDVKKIVAPLSTPH